MVLTTVKHHHQSTTEPGGTQPSHQSKVHLSLFCPLVSRLHLRNRNRNRNSTRSALAACGIALLVFALNEPRCARTGCLICTSFYGGRPREEIAAQEWDPKTLVRGSEAQGGLDREGEEGRPFGIDGKEFEGRKKAVGAGWQARVSAEGEM
jgi:hypothetical protein